MQLLSVCYCSSQCCTLLLSACAAALRQAPGAWPDGRPVDGHLGCLCGCDGTVGESGACVVGRQPAEDIAYSFQLPFAFAWLFIETFASCLPLPSCPSCS